MPEADPSRPTRPDLIEALHRWEAAGGTWRVAGRTSGSITVALLRCDGGEEVDRLSSQDPQSVQALAGRTGSDEGPLEPPR